jgi:hypothetical protein
MISKERKPLIVLKALLKGIRIEESSGHTYTIGTDEKEHQRLCVVGYSTTEKAEKLLPADMSLDGFLEWSSNLPEEALINVIFNLGLKKEEYE